MLGIKLLFFFELIYIRPKVTPVMDLQLPIFLLQTDIHWEKPVENLDFLDVALDAAPEDTALVLLPETFSTGFTMNAGYFAETEEGPTLEWMKKIARQRGVHLMGSVIFREDGRIYNRLLHVSPSGVEGHYDKRHLFRMGREDEHFTSGNSRVVFRVGDFRILPQVCYDLRFPVFARNRNDYDVLLYVANWPAPRHHVWETLLRARAIENQAWVVGVNRSGKDGEGVNHLGASCVINARGGVEKQLGPEAGTLSAVVDLQKIRELREKFPVWRDADNFMLDKD